MPTPISPLWFTRLMMPFIMRHGWLSSWLCACVIVAFVMIKKRLLSCNCQCSGATYAPSSISRQVGKAWSKGVVCTKTKSFQVFKTLKKLHFSCIWRLSTPARRARTYLITYKICHVIMSVYKKLTRVLLKFCLLPQFDISILHVYFIWFLFNLILWQNSIFCRIQ